ncbi:hypothetical protein CKM354_000780700 [Cercospora kikuchii]|uniref:Uncharacterized protein n=1 Tax=Cercospora kikuchii TaxID=84275 RepID=A0A9P3CKQ2_9PEZI|nr:uncharacterized protein CKM354_000780700 [Cercospora kikuchii]GIZ44614.1 hypothetical protein CKM354_000780700 [Cercospora kikuchii]
MHKHSYSQDSTLSGWSESSSLQPKSIHQRRVGESARSFKKNLFGAGLAFATGVLPVYFLVFAGLAHRYDGSWLEDSPVSVWLLEAARFGPSVFPIVFAAIVGQLMTTLASWRLENDIVIGMLEHLLASRSLASAFLSLFRLRILSVWTPLILLTWCLSPLGGQAALRVVSSTISRTTHPAWLVHVDWDGSYPVATYASTEQSYGSTIRSAFVGALSGNNNTKQESQDAFGNLRIPMLEAQTGQADKDGWYDTSSLEFPMHIALVGIPFSGAERHAKTMFTLRAAYFFLDCDVDINRHIYRDEISAYTAIPLENSAYEPLVKIYNHTRSPSQTTNSTRWTPLLRDLTANHQCNDTIPRVIGFQSRTYVPEESMVTEAWCNMTTSYIDARFSCDNGPQNCSVHAIRRSLDQPFPSSATGLDSSAIPAIELDHSCGGLASPQIAWSFFRQFMDALAPSRAAEYSPIEQYFLDPSRPFLQPNSTIPIGSIGPKLFSQRFSQLLNTFWLISVAPYAITGNFSALPSTNLTGDASVLADAEPTYRVRTTEGRAELSYTVLNYHGLWLATLILISLLLVCAAFVTAAFDICRKGPMVLDDFVNFLRHNPYARLDVRSSTEDGVDIVRRHRHVKVRLGDVRPEEDIGYLAVGTLGTGQALEKIKDNRLYS